MAETLWPGIPNGKAALALSGGASQGDFEVGVVRFLFERNYAPVLIASTSVGSINAIKLVEGGNIDPFALERIWLGLQNNDSMYHPNPVFDPKTLEAGESSLVSDFWTAAGGVVGTLVGLPVAPFVAIYAAVKGGIDISNLINAGSALLSANAMNDLNPLRALLVQNLDQRKVTLSATGLLMAVVSLESGDLRFVSNQGAMFQSDGITPFTQGELSPVCQPLADQVQSIIADLATGSDLPVAQRQYFKNQLAVAKSKLQACLLQNQGVQQPVSGVSVIDGAMASSSIPVIFPPVKMGTDNYCDGGIRAAIPIGAAINNGAKNIWAVLTYRNTTGIAFDPISNAAITNFDGATWVQIAARAAESIMPAAITDADVNPPAGWGDSLAVTVVMPEAGADVHNGLTVDPGLIRIRIAHGYMRADDVNTARWLAASGVLAGDYLKIGDLVSTVLHTTEIVNFRREIWEREHPVLGMNLVMKNDGTVLTPTANGVSDPIALMDVRIDKLALEQLVMSRRLGLEISDGTTPITFQGHSLAGSIPELPEPSSNLWMQFEHHQPISNPGNLPQPQVTLWPPQGLLLSVQGAVYIIFGGAAFHVPDPGTLTRLYGTQPITQLPYGRLTNLNLIPSIPADGTMLREEGGAVSFIFGGAQFHVPDPNTLSRVYGGVPVCQLWNGAFSNIPTIPVDGTLLRDETGAIFVIYGGAQFHVPNVATLNLLFEGWPWGQLWNGALANIPLVPVDYTLLREYSNPQVYIIHSGRKLNAPQGTTGTVHVLWDGALAQIPS